MKASDITDAISAVDTLVQKEVFTPETLADFRLKLQNAKSVIEKLENSLQDIQEKALSSFSELEADRQEIDIKEVSK